MSKKKAKSKPTEFDEHRLTYYITEIKAGFASALGNPL